MAVLLSHPDILVDAVNDVRVFVATLTAGAHVVLTLPPASAGGTDATA